MRKISFWAKDHPVLARTAVVLIKLSLMALAWFLGNLLLQSNIYLPVLLGIAGIILYILAAVWYPSVRSAMVSKGDFYIRRKIADTVLIVSTFVMMVVGVNNNDLFNSSSSVMATVPVKHIDGKKASASEILASLQYRDKQTLTREEKKILRREFKKQSKIYLRAQISGDEKKGKEALLIILTIIAAVGLLFVLAGLSCSIMCSGPEGLGVLVFVVGVVGLTVGAAALIRRIHRGPRQQTEAL